VIGKSNVKPLKIWRLRSKSDSNKPGPVLVELGDVTERNSILCVSKKLVGSEDYKSVFISPDLTEAERLLDYELRTERNKLNNGLTSDTQFRYGIRDNKVIKLKRRIN